MTTLEQLKFKNLKMYSKYSKIFKLMKIYCCNKYNKNLDKNFNKNLMRLIGG